MNHYDWQFLRGNRGDFLPIDEILKNAPINATHYSYYDFGKRVHYLKLTKKNTWVLLAYGKKFGITNSHVDSIGGTPQELVRQEEMKEDPKDWTEYALGGIGVNK